DAIRAIARVIGEFHCQAERSSDIDSYGGIDLIRANWEENFRQTHQFVGDTLGSRDLRFIEEWVGRFLGENTATFSRRVAGGFIRDCDGDIHMENICLTTARGICIFDCIEFNTRFRYGDTAADIAFLLMDFDVNRRPDFCGPFLDEYILTTGDGSVTEVLDFYKVYRAYIRGKVESMRLLDPQILPVDKGAARERAQRYFRLARGYIARRSLPPSLILTCGLTGTGKSFMARELAFDLGLEIVSSDVIRKELTGLSPTVHCEDRYGEGIYANAYTARTYGELLERAEAALAARRSVIVDATFRRRIDRDNFRQLAARHAARFHLLHATCPEETVRQRLKARALRAGEVSDGRWEIYLL
ncbi:kinase, partial [bacterium]|nr:kinase [bacterium]